MEMTREQQIKTAVLECVRSAVEAGYTPTEMDRGEDFMSGDYDYILSECGEMSVAEWNYATRVWNSSPDVAPSDEENDA